MTLKNISCALAFSCLSLITGQVQADTWSVNPEQSELGFEVQQGGSTLKGVFSTWTATIDFDPASPEAAKISAEINPASAATGNAQFDSTMPSKDWFDVGAFPAAEFKTESVTLVEGNSYKADGTLTIKGISQPVTLDFTLDIDGDTAKATGSATVNRLTYALGSNVGKDTVGDAVTVTLDLTANR